MNYWEGHTKMTNSEKKKKSEDIELPSLEEEIDQWCEVPTESDGKKGADDLIIDEWCKGSEEQDTKKKEKKE